MERSSEFNERKLGRNRRGYEIKSRKNGREFEAD